MFIIKKDPLIIGVDVVEGVMKTGIPIYCVEKNLPFVHKVRKELEHILDLYTYLLYVLLILKVLMGRKLIMRKFLCKYFYFFQKL